MKEVIPVCRGQAGIFISIFKERSDPHEIMEHWGEVLSGYAPGLPKYKGGCGEMLHFFHR